MVDRTFSSCVKRFYLQTQERQKPESKGHKETLPFAVTVNMGWFCGCLPTPKLIKLYSLDTSIILKAKFKKVNVNAKQSVIDKISRF